MASINLWSAMTSLASTDRAQADKAQEVVKLADQSHGFGNELELEVNEQGTWKIRVFSCYNDSNQEVELTILQSGHVSVKRKESFNGIQEERKISF